MKLYIINNNIYIHIFDVMTLTYYLYIKMNYNLQGMNKYYIYTIYSWVLLSKTDSTIYTLQPPYVFVLYILIHQQHTNTEYSSIHSKAPIQTVSILQIPNPQSL